MNINNVPAAIQIVISLEKKMVAATADIIGIRYKKLFVEAAPIWLKDPEDEYQRRQFRKMQKKAEKAKAKEEGKALL